MINIISLEFSHLISETLTNVFHHLYTSGNYHSVLWFCKLDFCRFNKWDQYNIYFTRSVLFHLGYVLLLHLWFHTLKNFFPFFIIEFSSDNMKIYSYMYDYIFYLIFFHPSNCPWTLKLLTNLNSYFLSEHENANNCVIFWLDFSSSSYVLRIGSMVLIAVERAI